MAALVEGKCLEGHSGFPEGTKQIPETEKGNLDVNVAGSL
jgi:hypothetical protein